MKERRDSIRFSTNDVMPVKEEKTKRLTSKRRPSDSFWDDEG